MTTTVFTLVGLDDITGWPGMPSSLLYELQGKITAGNTVVPISYPNFGLDNLMLLANFGPRVIPEDGLTSILEGVDALDDALTTTSGTKIVFGHSLGAAVACRWLRDEGPISAIPANELSFVLIGNPVRRYGGIDYRSEYACPTNTAYDVLDIARQYDVFADWPSVTTSPALFFAMVTEMTGLLPLHVYGYLDVDPTDTTTNLTATVGNITYMLAPTRPWWVPSYVFDFLETAFDRPEGDPDIPPPPSSSSALALRYPQGPITPQGACLMMSGDKPMVAYRSWDDTSVFNLMGPLAIADRMQPEAVHLVDLKGLVPPWKPIEQKGATQDGSTFITALYDPCDIDMTVEVTGKTPSRTRKVIDDWIAAWDAKAPGELSFFTPELGRWWSEVRWSKNPVDKVIGGTFTRQQFTWSARAYDAFWRSYDDACQFRYAGTGAIDLFDDAHASDLGSNWTLAYAGAGSGVIYCDGNFAVPTLVNRTAVARRNGYTTTTDDQVVECRIAGFSGWYFPLNAYNDLWARMNNSGTAGNDGIRLRISHSTIELSYFVGGSKTVLRERPLLIPAQSNEEFSLVAGTSKGARTYRVLRNGLPIMTVSESGTGSQLGASYRAVGFGMSAGSVLPASLFSWNAGDDTSFAHSGFVAHTNVGDQPMWPRYTCTGPGKFTIGDGPNGKSSITFGPLLGGQVVQLRTDPAKRGVVDLTSLPPTPQDLELWQIAIKDFISFATAGNVPPLLQSIESLFGIQPPQGPLYTLLDGRFSDNAAIPPKPAGTAAQTYHVAVSIADGDADSSIIAAGTPLRRWPY